METISIDYNGLKDKIMSLAQKDLSTISSGSLHLFSVDVETLVRSYVSQYSESIYEIGSSNLQATALDDFLNLESGYLIQMTNWINNSEFHFPEVTVFEYIEHEVDRETKHKKGKNNSSRRSDDFDNMSVIELFIDGLTSIFVRIPLRIVEKFSDFISTSPHSSRTATQNSKATQHTNTIREYASSYVSEVTRIGLNWARSAEEFSNNILSQY